MAGGVRVKFSTFSTDSAVTKRLRLSILKELKMALYEAEEPELEPKRPAF